jgi:hypothetical protein
MQEQQNLGVTTAQPPTLSIVSPDVASVTTEVYRVDFCGAGKSLIMLPDTGTAPGLDVAG